MIAGRDELADEYLDAIEAELRWRADHERSVPHEVDTLYIGGGTPTRLTATQLSRLCEIVDRWFPRKTGAEYTVEANPNDLDPAKLGVLVDAGVNRVSLGVQSFRDEKLKALDRDHSGDDARRAFELLRPEIPQIALDLMFAAPGETIDQWRAELDEAIALAPEHFSTYGLTYERGTTFFGELQRGKLQEADEEQQREMYLEAIERLGGAGWQQYEVSNFARAGCQSRHNENYWLGGRYSGIGAGASRFIGNERATNHRSTTTYIKRVLGGDDPTAERETLNAELLTRERVIFGLRRRAGIDLNTISADTGVDARALVGNTLANFVEHGLLQTSETRYWLTEQGLLVSDAIWPELL